MSLEPRIARVQKEVVVQTKVSVIISDLFALRAANEHVLRKTQADVLLELLDQIIRQFSDGFGERGEMEDGVDNFEGEEVVIKPMTIGRPFLGIGSSKYVITY